MRGYHVEWNNKDPKIGGHGNATTETAVAPKNSSLAENTETTIAQTSVTYVNSLEENITYKAEAPENTEIRADKAKNSNEKVVVKTQAIIKSNKIEIVPPVLKSSNANQSIAARESSDNDLLILVILALLIPPLAVFLKDGSWNARCWIALLLWFLFVIPGVIYALLVVLDAI